MSFPRFPADAPVACEDPGLGITGVVSSRPIRLPVVDDDARVRAAIGQTFALEAGLVIAAQAADATTALVLAERADPSVALVDVLLPDERTGLALVSRLNQRPGCAVVAMSVRGGTRRGALAARAVAFVEKSGDIDAVLDAVRGAAAPPQV
jgi:DNA-binding NarL/FixJ family response regulator